MRSSSLRNVSWSEWLLFATLSFVVTNFRPFARGGIVDAGGGNQINQLTWLTAACLAALIIIRNREAAWQLAVRSWPLFLLVGWILSTVLWSPYPDLALRRSILLAIMCFVGFGIAVGVRSPRSVATTLVIFTGVIMTVNVAGVLIIPDLSHAGNQVTGMHGEKNNAGQISASSFLIWLTAALLARRVWSRILLGLGAATWLIFLVLTGSKTSLGFAIMTPVAMLVALGVARASGLLRALLVAFLFGAVGGLLFLYLTLDLTVEAILVLLFNDTTFTGRVGLWEFLGTEIAKHPVIGAGYGSFWATNLYFTPLEFTDAWYATTTQAHNGYLDLLLQTGAVGLVLGLLVIGKGIVQSMRLLGLPGAQSGELWAYSTAFTVFVSMMIANFMESSYFRGGAFFTILFFVLYFCVERWSQASEVDERSSLNMPVAAAGGHADSFAGRET